MKTIILILSLAIFFLSLTSCRCNLADCRPDGGFITLKLVKDGHDVLFGPDASINRDSVKFFVLLDDGGVEEYISYNDSTKTMEVLVENRWTYILKIANIRTDTIIGTTRKIDTDECGCSSYRFIKVTINSQIVCRMDVMISLRYNFDRTPRP